MNNEQREQQIINEVDNYRDGDPVMTKLLNRNAAIGLALHIAEWADQYPQMKPENKLQDFKKKVEKLKEIDSAEEYAKQLAHLFLGNGLSLQTILLMAIDFGQQHPHWISVEEELPKENERIIAYNGVFDEIHLCDFHDGIFEDFYGPFNGTITHWIPLPVPPQGKEANNER